MPSKERKLAAPFSYQLKIAKEKIFSAEQSIRRQRVAIQEAQQAKSFTIANNGQKWIPKLEATLDEARAELRILQESAPQGNIS